MSEKAAVSERERSKRSRIVILISCAAAMAFLLLLLMVIVPKINYRKAVSDLNKGNFDEAYAVLEGLGKTEEVNKSKYERAADCLAAEDYSGAYALLSQISGYKDANEKLASLLENDPCLPFESAETGSTVKFGRYFMTGNKSKEDIEWRVLAKEKGRMLVISEYALDCVQFNDALEPVTWETCSLRGWLNSDFMNEAFSANEQSVIAETTVEPGKNPNYDTEAGGSTKDRIFLLSAEEAGRYFGSNDERVCILTDYAKSRGAYTGAGFTKDEKAVCWWWLRTPGVKTDRAANVGYTGTLGLRGSDVIVDEGCVRPAMWVEYED